MWLKPLFFVAFVTGHCKEQFDFVFANPDRAVEIRKKKERTDRHVALLLAMTIALSVIPKSMESAVLIIVQFLPM